MGELETGGAAINFETLQLDSPDIPELCREEYRAQLGEWPAPGQMDDRAAVWAMAWLSKPDAQAVPIGPDHKGMTVDYSGLLGQCARVVRRTDPIYAEMLGQLQGHIMEMGQCYYSGDIAAVDEFLQLYCVERESRKQVVMSGREEEPRHD